MWKRASSIPYWLTMTRVARTTPSRVGIATPLLWPSATSWIVFHCSRPMPHSRALATSPRRLCAIDACTSRASRLIILMMIRDTHSSVNSSATKIGSASW